MREGATCDRSHISQPLVWACNMGHRFRGRNRSRKPEPELSPGSGLDCRNRSIPSYIIIGAPSSAGRCGRRAVEARRANQREKNINEFFLEKPGPKKLGRARDATNTKLLDSGIPMRGRPERKIGSAARGFKLVPWTHRLQEAETTKGSSPCRENGSSGKRKRSHARART